uniref:SRCR domain-containing protein n=1 Tax=Oncorhynchus tshawytscha TaxID=74940 RepID=A0AAZ3PSL8_ONCTS
MFWLSVFIDIYYGSPLAAAKDTLPGEIRLVDGTSRCSGTVEILYKGQWGRVCGQKWDVNNANVVCGHGGSQNTLIFVVSTWHRFNKPNIRLVNGSDLCSGRVEVYQTGHWRTVCDDVWDLNDAAVVCRQLGCGRADSAPERAYFGQGSGPIWQDDVGCSGTECSITQCPHTGGGTHNCNHGNDTGVICSEIRLVDGTSRCSGTVEILYKGQWGLVCGQKWDVNDANVVCGQLGCGRAVSAQGSAHIGEGSGGRPTWLDDVGCKGTESSLTECSHGGLKHHDCLQAQDARVVCSGKKSPSVAIVVDKSQNTLIFIVSTWHRFS